MRSACTFLIGLSLYVGQATAGFNIWSSSCKNGPETVDTVFAMKTGECADTSSSNSVNVDGDDSFEAANPCTQPGEDVHALRFKRNKDHFVVLNDKKLVGFCALGDGEEKKEKKDDCRQDGCEKKQLLTCKAPGLKECPDNIFWFSYMKRQGDYDVV